MFRGSVHCRDIERALAQLQWYFDDHSQFPYDILVMYNLTQCPITMPGPIRGRFQTMAINLVALIRRLQEAHEQRGEILP